MQDFESTIREYETSHEQIKTRIRELGEQMAKCRSHRQDSTLKQLSERRSKLYTSLWDIEYALREMREYVRPPDNQEVNERVG